MDWWVNGLMGRRRLRAPGLQAWLFSWLVGFTWIWGVCISGRLYWVILTFTGPGEWIDQFLWRNQPLHAVTSATAATEGGWAMANDKTGVFRRRGRGRLIRQDQYAVPSRDTATGPWFVCAFAAYQRPLWQILKSCVFSERRLKTARDKRAMVIVDYEFLAINKSSKWTVVENACFEDVPGSDCGAVRCVDKNIGDFWQGRRCCALFLEGNWDQ